MTGLRLRNVRKHFGATEILRGVTLDIRPGERHAIIGPNGAGKSTLFHVISGLLPPSAGSIHLGDTPIHHRPAHEIARLGLSRSFQVSQLFTGLDVFDNLRCAQFWRHGYGHSFWHGLGRQDALNHDTQALLDRLGLSHHAHTRAADLPYAAQRALELGIAIAADPSVILLDEPVAGMSRSEARAAVALIREVTAGRTLVLVEHDLTVVFELADRISVLVQGQIIATDTPAAIRAHPGVREAYLGEVAHHA